MAMQPISSQPCVFWSSTLTLSDLVISKEEIWRYLLRVPLTEKQRERLRQVALGYVQKRLCREFAPMCRMISGIVTEKFERQVRMLQDSADPKIKHRAALLMAYFQGISQGERFRLFSAQSRAYQRLSHNRMENFEHFDS